jgi:single-stranded-DNA-specific exonuclease
MKVKPLLKSIDPSNFLSQYLQALGIQDVDKYLNAGLDVMDSPLDYPNMKEGVERLRKAIDNGEKIGVLIDPDVDGQLSAALIVKFLLRFTNNLTYFFHVGKGHGLVQNKEEDIVQQIIHSEVKLIIIPDAGSNDSGQCGILKSVGIDVIICDHHEVTTPNPYAIIINHHLGEGLNTALSGTGVTHKFAISCAESWNIDLRDLYYDLVATSIISDVCDLTTLENRAYVKYGFEHITDPMLELMFAKFNRKGNNPIGISWGTAPPINSLCRGDDQQAKMDFFMALIGKGDMDEGISIARKAHNEQTKIVKTIYQEIEPDLDRSHKVMIGYTTEEYKGYTGLIANKITGNFGKPALVLRELNSTTWSGSLRSPVDIADKINESKLAKCQGHLSAAGIFLKKSNLNRLIKWFDALPLDADPERQVTAILKPSQITLPLCHACSDDMVLWGASEGNKIVQPKFYLEFETSQSDIQVFVKKTTTVKITKDNVSFLKFQCDDETAQLLQRERCKVAMIIKLSVNEWNGVESPQAIIDTWEIEKIEEDGFNFDALF